MVTPPAVSVRVRFGVLTVDISTLLALRRVRFALGGSRIAGTQYGSPLWHGQLHESGQGLVTTHRRHVGRLLNVPIYELGEPCDVDGILVRHRAREARDGALFLLLGP